jgi:hypothetical protein
MIAIQVANEPLRQTGQLSLSADQDLGELGLILAVERQDDRLLGVGPLEHPLGLVFVKEAAAHEEPEHGPAGYAHTRRLCGAARQGCH